MAVWAWTVIACGIWADGAEPLRPAARPPLAVPSAQTSPEQNPSSSGDKKLPERPYAPQLDDVRPSSFRDVTPGVTKVEELESVLGKPVSRGREGDSVLFSFRVEPFPRVEVRASGETVASVTANFPGSVPVDQVERQLGLSGFSFVTLTSDVGEPVGRAYPERGVLLTYEGGSSPPRVMQIVLDPISAEPFVRRAESDRRHLYQKQLTDLDYAIRIDPTNAEAFWRKSEIQLTTGRYGEALEAADRALRLEPDDNVYRLARAVALTELGQGRDAAEELKRVFHSEALTGYVKAFAYQQIANLLAGPPYRKLSEATKHRLTAVQLATPLASSPRVVLRRQARQLLVHTYVGLARDIAAGDWSDKTEAVNKWLRGAGEIAEAMIEQDGAGEAMRFLVLCESLAAHADIDADDLELEIDAALEMGLGMLESARDPLYQLAVRRQLAKLEFDAARIMLARRDASRSQDLAQQAAATCEDLFKDREMNPSDEDWVGRMYFYLGSLYALQERNHREAARWYERALPLLTKTAPLEASGALGRHGERLVSMGVSYWAVGARNEAIRLTKEGIEALEKASTAGHFARQELVVPYGNLASMYESLGKNAEARRMASLAQKIEAARETSPK